MRAPLEPLTTRTQEPVCWRHDRSQTFLNHGSYGLVPEVVGAAQTELRRRMDLDPVRFFKIDLERYADAAREAVGAFVNAPPACLAPMPNATYAMATILRSVELEPGDEIVLTDHEYQATVNELDALCARTGARTVVARVPLACASPDIVVEAIAGALSERTRLVIASHVASASALVFPVDRIVDLARARGVEVLIDGAHAPGQVEIDLARLQPTYYAASCHKWLGAPKGSGFIYVDASRRERVKPVVQTCRTHAVRADRSPFLCDFDYWGTGDFTPNLVIPVAIEHLGAQLPGGWAALRRRNHEMAIGGARVVASAIGVELPAPEGMYASMVGLALPDAPGGQRAGSPYEDRLWDRLVFDHGIQVPIWELPGVAPRLMRLSAHLYNGLADFEALGAALRLELEEEGGRD